MREINLLIFVTLTFYSCTTDNQATDDFIDCLETNERMTYFELVQVCDDFIMTNYPDKELNQGYEDYLNDLELDEPNPKTWKIDTLKVLEMNKKIKLIFGDNYDSEEANFSADSRIITCLKKVSNKKGIDKFIKQKEDFGYIGPNIVASGMKASGASTTRGLNKTIFVTEVIWRQLYLNLFKN